MTRALLFDAPGPPGPAGPRGPQGSRGGDGVGGAGDVTKFGADPTGGKDSTSAIQAAFAAAPVNGMVVFPAGIFRIAASIPVLPGTRVVGAGPKSILQFEGSGNLFNIDRSGDNLDADNSIEYLAITTIGQACDRAIYAIDAYDLYIDQVHILVTNGSGFQLAGIEVYGTTNKNVDIHIKDCDIDGCRGPGVLVSGTQPAPITIYHCNIHENAIGVSVTVSPYAHVHIINNIIEGNSGGQVKGNFGHGSRIDGNHFEDPFDGATMLQLDNFTSVGVSGNIFTRGSASPPDYYISLATGDGVKIDTNWFSSANIALVNWSSGDNVIWAANRNQGAGLELKTSISSTGLHYTMPKSQGRNSLQGMGGDRLGITSSSTATANALATSNVIDVEAGTYLITSTVPVPSTAVLFKGQGKGQSIFKAGSTSPMFDISGGVGQQLSFEDLTFDCSSTAWAIEGGAWSNVSFKRCNFINVTQYAWDTSASAIGQIVFEDCDFDGAGKMIGTAVALNGAPESVRFSRCTFRGLYQGVLLVGTGAAKVSTQNVAFDDCFFDMGYYSGPTLLNLTNSGTVTYTSTALVDTARTWPALGSPGTPGTLNQFGIIRALHAVSSGTCTSTMYQLTASTATFLSSGLLEGDIVRCGTAQAIIVSVESDTVLNLEEWRSVSTAQLLTPPTGAYVAYRVLTGKINTASVNTIGLYGYWQDLNGTQTTPSSGDLYECVPTTNYPIESQSTVRHLRVSGCTFVRSYTDQVSTFGDRNTICHNVIHHGQDFGVTCNQLDDGRSDVHDNLVYCQGSGCIYWGGSNGHVHHNRCVGWGTRNKGLSNSTDGAAGIYANPAGTATAGHNIFDHNILDGDGLAESWHGIIVFNQTNSQFLDNTIYGLNGSGHEYTVQGSSTSNIVIRHEGDDIAFVDKGSGGLSPNQRISVYGTASPNARLAAAIGSTFIDKTNGHMYFNASGTTTWSTVV